MDELDRKVLSIFPGKVVRKDLVGPLKGHLNVPTYVLEYLLGRYCSSSDPEIIKQGIQEVRRILSENFVHPDQAELVKSKIREKGSYRIIDKVKARLIETEDRYWAELTNLQLTHVNINENLIREYEKLLGGGIWAIVDLSYDHEVFHGGVQRPFVIDRLRPIQLPITNLDQVLQNRKSFTREEWIDLLIRSIGLEPSSFDHRKKILLLCRLLPLIENNYNYVELGPRGTGKSYCYRELSPYCILISGGETTVPRLFMSLAGRGQIGLVGLWDVVAFDEVAGLERLSSPRAIQVLKDYMESGSFSRGREEVSAMASLVFVGNIDLDIGKILRSSHLFISFPDQMLDPAFIDRFHLYLPGWEVPKIHPSFFGAHYGFVVDFIAEMARELRKMSYTSAIDEYFKLGKSITKRDEKGIRKTVSGLIKLIHPDGIYSKEDVEEYLQIALEMRRRVREQLRKIGGVEYWDVKFTYIDQVTSIEHEAEVPEQELIEPAELPSEPMIGESIGLAVIQSYGAIQRFEVIINEGTGKLIPLGSMKKVMRESLRAAYEYISNNILRLGIDPDFKKDYDISVLATEMGVPKYGPSAGLTILVALVSALTQKPVRNDVAMTGEITLFGRILPVGGIPEKLVAAAESGINKVYIPAGNSSQVDTLPDELRKKLEIRPVGRVEDVLNDIILDYHTTTDEELEREYIASEPYILLKELESCIREFIESKLSALTKNWWKERIPQDVRESTEERKDRNAALWPWTEKEEDHPIYYINFPEYEKIITKRDNWREIFSTYFTDRNIITTKLRELEPIRNKIAHFRELTKSEKTKLQLYSKEILNCISI